jgi:hypothetical protein
MCEITVDSVPMIRAILYYFAIVLVLTASVLLLSWYLVVD